MHLLWKGDTRLVREILQSAPSCVVESHLSTYMHTRLAFLDRRIDDALAHFPEGMPGPPIDSSDYYIAKGQLLFFSGDIAGSREYFDSLLELAEGRLASERSEADWQNRTDLVWAYAGLGMSAEAREEGEEMLRATAESEDAARRAAISNSMVRVYMMIGEYERALDLLEQLLTTPNDQISLAYVRLDPWFDPLRENPRFKALMERHGK
jgi:tetratricopeptide (TPR) repeat protein